MHTALIVNFRQPGTAFAKPHRPVRRRKPSTEHVPYLARHDDKSCIVARTVDNSVAITYSSFEDFRRRRNSLYVLPDAIVPYVVSHGTDTWRIKCKPGPKETIRCSLNTVKLTPHVPSMRKAIHNAAYNSLLSRGEPVYLGIVDSRDPDVDLGLLEKLRETGKKRLVIILHLNQVVPADHYGDTIFTISCPFLDRAHPVMTDEVMILLCALLKTRKSVSRLKQPLSVEPIERYLQVPSDLYLQ